VTGRLPAAARAYRFARLAWRFSLADFNGFFFDCFFESLDLDMLYLG
jgi:hypothetical protein